METDVHGRLAGRRILITGAASGIGLETAKLFVREGAQVALFDLAFPEPLDDALSGSPVFALDIRDQPAVVAACEASARALGGLDGLVNCAGTFVPGLTEDGDLAAWDRNISVNLTGAFVVAAATIAHLRVAEAATIVNVSSGIALLPGAGQGAYAASKAGLLAWTRVAAQELGPRIRVNATCPGATDTPLMRANSGGKPMSQLGDGRALERASLPIEQAHAILYLTSSESSYVTGATVPVDGGRTYY